MSETALIAGTAFVAAAGLMALYSRITHEFDRVTAVLSTVMLAGATPLLPAVLNGSIRETAFFAVLSGVTLVAARLSRSARAALLFAAVAAGMVVARAAERPTLFTPESGFLALSPLLYIAVVSALVRVRSHPEESTAAVAALLLWPVAHTSLLPAVALLGGAMGALVDFARRRPIVAIVPLVGGVIVWNYWLMVQYTAGTIPKDAPVSFAALVRQQADVYTRPPFVYPFAFPGNAFAAWRDGIPLSRYDLLAAEVPRESFELRLDRSGDRFLLDGWGPLAANSPGSYRPISGAQATALVPLQVPKGGVEIRVVGATRRNDRPSEHNVVAVRVNADDVGRLSIGPEAAESRVHVPAADVGRVFRAGYNRLTLVPTANVPVIIYGIRLGPGE